MAEKLKVSEFRDSIGVLDQYAREAEQLDNDKNFYYEEAKTVLESLKTQVSIIDTGEKLNYIIFKFGSDLKFRFELINKIKFVEGELRLYESTSFLKECLSDIYSYSFTFDSHNNFSDVEEVLDDSDFRKHFRTILLKLINQIIAE